MIDETCISFFKKQAFFIVHVESGDILDVNEVAIDLYGYDREEFLEMNLGNLQDNGRKFGLFDRVLNGGQTQQDITVLQTKTGEKVHVQFTSHLMNYEGQPVKFLIAHNVTEKINGPLTTSSLNEFPKPKSKKVDYPLAEIIWDSNLCVKRWSDKAEKLFGWKSEEVVGDQEFFKDFIAEKELDEAISAFKEVVESKQKHYITEGRVLTGNGSYVTCTWYNYLQYSEEDELTEIHTLVADITNRKETETLFKALSEESMVGVYLIQDGKFQYVNPRFAEIFGYDQEELLEMSPFDLTHPKDKQRVEENIKKRIEGEITSEKYEVKCYTKSGNEIDVSVFGTAISYLGKPAVVGTLMDISESKEIINKYRASIESYRDLFDSISDAIYIQDKEGRFLEVNKGAVEMYGYDQEFFIGKTPDFLAAPGKVDLEKTRAIHEKALTGEPQSFEWWGKRKNGEVFPKEVVQNTGTYFGEEVVITIGRDISDRYEAAEQMRKNEEMFRQLFQNSPIPIAFMDKRQEVRQVNAAFSETFGYQTEEVSGLNIDKLLVPEGDMEAAREISQQIFEGQTAFYSGKRLTKDGTPLDVLIYGVPVIVDGKTVAIFGIYVDITDRKQAEERVRKSLKEKEVLLAEIHHRVKNNLAVITGMLELQAFNTEAREAREVLQISQMRVNSIALIHEKLYQSDNLSEISFDVYLKELVDVIVSSMRSAHTDVDITIDADPVELTVSQAIPCGLILNELITNAYKHAFPDCDAGSIVIGIKQEGEQIHLTVADNGVGISDEVDIDNPKSLGIKLIRTLSRQLEGNESFQNGSGTRFQLEFKLKE